MKRNITKGVLVCSLMLTGAALYSQETSATALSENESTVTVAVAVETAPVAGKPSVTDLPGFPVFVNTGDPVGDDARYEAAKNEWYAENKKLVKKFYRQN